MLKNVCEETTTTTSRPPPPPTTTTTAIKTTATTSATTATTSTLDNCTQVVWVEQPNGEASFVLKNVCEREDLVAATLETDPTASRSSGQDCVEQNEVSSYIFL